VADNSQGTLIAFLFLLFSLVPVIPALGYYAARWMLQAKSFVVHGVMLPIHSFLFWYLTCASLAASIFGVWLRYSSSSDKKRQAPVRTEDLLNEPQMRFAICYALCTEIEAYRTNKRVPHMERASSLWKDLLPSLHRLFGFGSQWREEGNGPDSFEQYMLAREGLIVHPQHEATQFFPQLHKLITTLSWFQVNDRTASIISAFDALRSKIRDRIKDKKDLFQVSKCLTPLSVYLYTQIPDISDTELQKQNFHQVEKDALDVFVTQMGLLEPYKSERRKTSKIKAGEARRAKLGNLLLATVGSGSPFIRFASIWFIVQIFVAVTIPVFILTIKALKIDSTMIALLVGSPLAIAAALTAVPPADPRRKRRR
jgi:hypothetical protein